MGGANLNTALATCTCQYPAHACTLGLLVHISLCDANASSYAGMLYSYCADRTHMHLHGTLIALALQM